MHIVEILPDAQGEAAFACVRDGTANWMYILRRQPDKPLVRFIHEVDKAYGDKRLRTLLFLPPPTSGMEEQGFFQ